MQYMITIDHKKCVLCRYCEIVCSLALKSEFVPDISVIKEIKSHKSGTDVLRCKAPNPCLEEPKCVNACDQRALTYVIVTR